MLPNTNGFPSSLVCTIRTQRYSKHVKLIKWKPQKSLNPILSTSIVQEGYVSFFFFFFLLMIKSRASTKLYPDTLITFSTDHVYLIYLTNVLFLNKVTVKFILLYSDHANMNDFLKILQSSLKFKIVF